MAAVADALSLKRFVLVGHSLGAAAAIAYANAHSDRVAGLLLVAPPAKVSNDQAQQIMKSMTANYEKVTQEFWQKLLSGARPDVKVHVESQMRSVPREASLRIIAEQFAFDAVPPLEHYPGPRLAILTSHNNTPNDLHNLVHGLPVKRIDGTSHWPHLDKPEEFDTLMDEFLLQVGDQS